MNNYDQHDQIEQEILKHTPRQLVRRIIELEEQLKEAKADNNKIRGRMHDQWIRQNKMKAEAVMSAIHATERMSPIDGDLYCDPLELEDYANKLEKGEV